MQDRNCRRYCARIHRLFRVSKLHIICLTDKTKQKIYLQKQTYMQIANILRKNQQKPAEQTFLLTKCIFMNYFPNFLMIFRLVIIKREIQQTMQNNHRYVHAYLYEHKKYKNCFKNKR